MMTLQKWEIKWVSLKKSLMQTYKALGLYLYNIFQLYYIYYYDII